MKAALKVDLQGNSWIDRLPWVMLGLRTAPKEDLLSSSAELVYGQALRDLQSARYVFIRHDAHRNPLQPPYDGPYRVVETGDKTFIIDIGGSMEHISVDRLKTAHLDGERAVELARPTTSWPPSCKHNKNPPSGSGPGCQQPIDFRPSQVRESVTALDESSEPRHVTGSRYTGLSLRCSMTLGSSPHAGLQMKRKLLSILRLKCHALFLDLKMNSPEAVCQNIYKIVLFLAYRFHACAQNLPFGQKVKKNTSFFLLLIWKMAKCTSLHIKQNNRGVPLPVGLCYKAVELMYCVAFLFMMSCHRCLYKCLLSHIRMRKGHLERRLGGLKEALIRRSFTPIIPDDFKLIRM
ncbi:hypothetical protein AAFF_G00055470 [Aldrovandia affinis]|uniref:Telomerase reverse transcriptase n=1 Tax=Aldrovandia affinis TaxID=143900 RepID=A0AAD7R1Y3_9TELE|nr:hypothetical protein AAFF_G00055470 [Aldrovandia affinis]